MILCCGEALIDMLPVAGGGAFAPHPGGAVFNTAVALGRLGARTGFFSGLSADFLGDLLRDRLHEARVETRLCVTAPRPCTLAFVRLVDAQATYAFYDEGTAGRMLTEADLPETLDATPAEALFFGGISLAAEPCGSAYEALMRREAGRRVMMIDPNIRPGFIAHEGAYRARLARMLGMADIVKLSSEDLDWLAPGQGESFARGLIEGGAALVLLTDGGKGATAITRDHKQMQPAHRVTVVDTVGAGDTFNAGILASFQADGVLTRQALAGLTPEVLGRALALASAAAAVTVSRAGANPPWSSELP